VERSSITARVAKVACAATSSSSVVWTRTRSPRTVLVLALVDGVAVELLAEVFLAPGTGFVVLPGRERLVAAVAGILVCALEKLVAVLLRVRLCPFHAGLDVAQLFLEVPDRSVVEFPPELVRRELEPPCHDLVAPAEVLVGAVDELHLSDHVLHEVGLREVLVEVEVLDLSQP
jgi:hypothetical protein